MVASHRQWARIKAFCIALAVPALLSGCAVATPISVTSIGQGADQSQPLLLASDDTDTGLRAEFRAALAQALADHGFTQADTASQLADFSVSVRAADGGLTTKEGEAKSADQVNWTAEPKNSDWLDKCEPQRIRATLVIYDRANGDVRYRGEGEAIDCRFDAPFIRALADRLVRDALSRRVG